MAFWVGYGFSDRIVWVVEGKLGWTKKVEIWGLQNSGRKPLSF